MTKIPARSSGSAGTQEGTMIAMPIDTKQAIADAFRLLMVKKEFDKITVKDISDVCGIARQSFYYHFQNTLDLVEWIVEQSIRDTIRRTLEEEDPVASIEHFVLNAVNHHGLMLKLRSSQHHEHFQFIFVQAVETYLAEFLRHSQPELTTGLNDLKTACQFYACGIVGLLLLRCGDRNLDTKKLARQICLLITKPGEG
ncbi:MAG: TetR family transcriptional regulator [Lachnospiraceae bacterium]|nr:TetR family transcriptional regulator [Lachnospiraceae bacterium]